MLLLWQLVEKMHIKWLAGTQEIFYNVDYVGIP